MPPPDPAATVAYLALCGPPPTYPLLASFSNSSPSDFEATLRTLFSSPGWASSMLDEARTRLELKSGSHLFCIEIDKGPGGEGIARVYCCVVGAAYPTRFIFSAGASASSSSSSPPRAMADFRALVARALPPLGAGGEGEADALALASESGGRIVLRIANWASSALEVNVTLLSAGQPSPAWWAAAGTVLDGTALPADPAEQNSPGEPRRGLPRLPEQGRGGKAVQTEPS